MRSKGRRRREEVGRQLTTLELRTVAHAVNSWISRRTLRDRLRGQLSKEQFKRLGSAQALCRLLVRHKQPGVDVISIPRPQRERLQNVLNVTLEAIDKLTGECGIRTWTAKGRRSDGFKRVTIFWIAGREPAESLSSAALMQRMSLPRLSGIASTAVRVAPENGHSVSVDEVGVPLYSGGVERGEIRDKRGEQQTTEGSAESLNAPLSAHLVDLSVPAHELQALAGGLAALGELKRNPSPHRAEEVARRLRDCFPPLDDRANWFKRRHLLRVAELGSQLIAEHRLGSEVAAQLLYRAGVAAESLGDAEAAQRYLERTTELCESNGLTRLLGWSLTQLADAKGTLGDQGAAEQLTRRVLSLREEHGASRDLLAHAHLSVGSTLIDTSMRELGSPTIRRAINHLEKARALWAEEAAQGNTSQYAWCLHSLAMSRFLLGDAAGARAAFGPALRLKQDEVGKDHPVMAYLKALGARLLLSEGDLRGATLLADEALDVWTNAFDDRHPMVVRLLLLSTDLAHKDGRTRAALATLEQAEEARRVLIPGNRNVEDLVSRTRARLMR